MATKQEIIDRLSQCGGLSYQDWIRLLDSIYFDGDIGDVYLPTTSNVLPQNENSYTTFSIITEGTYTQSNGSPIVVPEGYLAIISNSNGTWSNNGSVKIKGDKGIDGKTIEDWTAKSYVAGSNVYYNNGQWLNSSPAIATDIPSLTSSIWSLRGGRDVINISLLANNNNFANSTDARNAIPTSYRKAGLEIRYKSAGQWISEQFIGTDILTWVDDINWRKNILLLGVLNLSAFNKNYSYANAATARSSVPTYMLQEGLEIRYKLSSGAWMQEKFLGGGLWRNDGLDVVNVSALTSNYNIPTLSNAIGLLPLGYRRFGIELRFKSSGVYKSYQFTGGSNITTDFENVANWSESSSGIDEFLTEANQAWTL